MHEKIYDCCKQTLDFDVDLGSVDVIFRELNLRKDVLELSYLYLESIFHLRFFI